MSRTEFCGTEPFNPLKNKWKYIYTQLSPISKEYQFLK